MGTILTENQARRLCLKTRSGFERPFFHLAASGCIDDRTNIACFAVFARRKQRLPLSETRLRQQPKTAKEKIARSRADDGVFRKSLA